jgi:uncharacterized protein DUF326
MLSHRSVAESHWPGDPGATAPNVATPWRVLSTVSERSNFAEVASSPLMIRNNRRTPDRVDRGHQVSVPLEFLPQPRGYVDIYLPAKEELMTRATDMLDTYPSDLGAIDKQALGECIDACVECAQACTACADACLSEKTVAELVKCVRTNLDCADLCDATGRILSRHTGYDANLTTAAVRACLTACRTCADECERHADMHQHCRVCAEACRRCEQACQRLLTALG